ncbi:alanine/glycine:cation symporter family protein [Marilutibacter aestuarii]|uniref:Alanine:cation symporter family protein n=1 Tax=Marilutibacter aestuarii TaxID=1706195 RepID=A0A508AEF5_9GAMM|nr:alanine/glycine:cation symporter family protein [Lysobacter aestuarii]TQD48239.1 alanine:cation symporter family protein [Lysobacter aestuarii]
MQVLLDAIEAVLAPVVGAINTVLWDYVLVYGLLAVGVYFSLRLRGLQFRRFGHMLRLVARGTHADDSGISPFQALCTSLAARVGTGNLAGVAIALAVGGPGALFWMWCTAVLGMATAYAESTLAQLYKVRGEDGQYRGGPSYYMTRGLKHRWMGVAFALALLLSYGLVFSSVHANAMAQALEGAFGLAPVTVASGLVVLTAAIIFGGLRSVARFASWVVPFMSVAYLLLAGGIVLTHLPQVPGVLLQVLRGAFGLDAAAGGLLGVLSVAMLQGVKRGLYSNEAGMGSAPNVAAAVTPVPHHPASQGLVQALGVFIDTLLVCTATGIIILLSGVLGEGGHDGVQVTQAAMTVFLGDWGAGFVAVAMFFFAFTTILGNYSYAESNLLYLGGGRMGLLVLRLAALATITWGVFSKVQLVWDAADASMAVMASINLVAIVMLSGVVVRLTRDYDAQLRAGGSPTFRIVEHPGMASGVDGDIWR